MKMMLIIVVLSLFSLNVNAREDSFSWCDHFGKMPLTRKNVSKFASHLRTAHFAKKTLFHELIGGQISEMMDYTQILLVKNRFDKNRSLVKQVFDLFDNAGFARNGIASLAYVESLWQFKVRSYRGAIGLYQITLPTARLFCGQHMTAKMLGNPVTNAKCSVAIHKVNGVFGDWKLALQKYNGLLRRSAVCAGGSFYKYLQCVLNTLKRKLPRRVRRYLVESLHYVPRYVVAREIQDKFFVLP